MGKRLNLGIALLVLCRALLAWTGTAAAMEIKSPHVVYEKDAFHVAPEKFQELVERESKGELTATIFPSAKLGEERTLVERMKMGIVDGGIITSGPIISFVPWLVMVLPRLLMGGVWPVQRLRRARRAAPSGVSK